MEATPPARTPKVNLFLSVIKTGPAWAVYWQQDPQTPSGERDEPQILPGLIYVAFMRNLLYKEFYSIKLEMRPDS